jgi:hypothetical protein
MDNSPAAGFRFWASVCHGVEFDDVIMTADGEQRSAILNALSIVY